MKITKITIDNFKIHKHIDLDLKNLTVLTGQNSCGKSSIIESLLLLRQNVMPENTLSVGLQINGDLFNGGKANDMLCEFADNDQISFHLGLENNIPNLVYSYKIDVENGNKDFIPVDKVENIEQNLKEINLFGDEFQYISATRISPQDIYVMDTLNVENRKQISKMYGNCELLGHFLYYYGIKKPIQVNEYLKKEETDSANLINQISAWEQSISENINVNVHLTDDNKYIIGYTYNKKNDIVTTNERSVKNVGVGITYALPIITSLLSAKKDGMIIIENPEADLHPHAQSELGKLIAMAAQSGLQIILETHSDHILNGIYIASKFFENGKKGIDKENVAIYYLDKNAVTLTSEVKKINIVGDGRIDNQPQGFSDQYQIDLSYLLDF